jgi:hypothetical protein
MSLEGITVLFGDPRTDMETDIGLIGEECAHDEGSDEASIEPVDVDLQPVAGTDRRAPGIRRIDTTR